MRSDKVLILLIMVNDVGRWIEALVNGMQSSIVNTFNFGYGR